MRTLNHMAPISRFVDSSDSQVPTDEPAGTGYAEFHSPPLAYRKVGKKIIIRLSHTKIAYFCGARLLACNPNYRRCVFDPFCDGWASPADHFPQCNCLL